MVSKAKRRGHWTDLFRDYELKADVRLVDHEAPRVLRQILGQMLREASAQCTPTRLPKGAPGVRMLLPQKEVESFPVVEVEIAERRERLQAAAGLTVGKIRESFQVPIDWTAVLGEELVADNYPILRDCFLLFRRRSVGEAMAAGVCGVIRAQGCCLQREDDRNWIAFNELYEIIPGKQVRMLSPAEWELLKNEELLLKLPPEELETLFNGELRMLSEKALKTLFRDEGIRYFNPTSQRLVYHCGDYCRFVLRRIRQREQVLDAAADPKAIVSGTAALSLEAGFRRLYKRKKGGK